MTGIRVELQLDDGSFTTRMIRAGQSVEQFEQSVGRSIRSVNSLQSTSQGFLGTLRDVTVVLGQASAAISFMRSATTGWVGEIVKVNAEFERTRKLLEGLATSTDKVKEAGDDFAYLRDQAKQTPYSLQGLTDVFVKMKSAGIDPTKGAMRGLVDATAAFGGTEEQLKRATLAIQQMAGKGVVQMEELRQQLGEAIPRATELMARSMGVSYSELVKLLATGTVSAKEAIAAMSGEFERTFGGAALARMQTFDGVVATLGTTFQDLAVKVGKGGGFFETLTKKAGELNGVLQSRDAGALADKLGSGLASVLGMIESVLGRIVYFKSEIIAVGSALAYGFGAAKTLEAVNALGTAVSNASGQIKAITIAWSSFGANFTATQSALTTAGAGLASFRAGLAATRVAIAATAAALIELAPVLIAVGMGVSFAISYFDLFGKKAREARKEVEDLGAAASKESLKFFVKDIGKQRDELERLQSLRARVNPNAAIPLIGNGDWGKAGVARLDAEIVAQQKKVDALEARAAQIGGDYQINAAQRVADEKLRIFDEGYRDQLRFFDIYGKELADKQEAALAKAANAGKSTEALKASYQKAERERELSIYDLRIANLQDYYEELKKLSATQTGQEKQQTDRIIQGIIERQKTAQKARETLEASPMGVTLLAKPIDEDKLFKKGQAALDSMQASIAGLRASLAGANGDVVELQEQLAKGKYGPEDSARVKELIANLLEAQAQKTKLDEIMEGRNKFERDLTNAQMKAEQDLFEARNKNISDIDKLIVNYEAGLYKGMGPTQTPMERAVQAARAQLQQATKEAGETAQAVWGRLLGGENVGQSDNAIDKLKEMARIMGLIRGDGAAIQALNLGQGVNTSAATTGTGGSARGAGASTDPVSTNLPPAAIAFLNAISGPESAGRYNVRYTPSGGTTFDSYDQHPRIKEASPNGPSTAAGRYQIVATTWDRLGMGDKSFSPENQDMAAWRLAMEDFKRNSGGGDLLTELNANGFSDKVVAALKSTWEGLQSGSGANKARDWYGDTIRRRGGNTVEADSGYMPANRTDSRARIPTTIPQDDAERMAVARAAQQLATIETNDNAVKESLKEIIALTEKAEEREDGYGKRVSETRRLIREGKFGTRDGETDPENARYEKLIAAVEKLDKAEEAAARAQQMRQRLKAAGEGRERTREELALKEQELARRINEESTYKLPDSVFRARADQLRTEDRYKELMNGGDKSFDQKGYDQLVADNQAIFDRLKSYEVSSTIQAEQKKTREIERGLMTADQQREASFQEEIKRLNDLASQVSGNAEQRAQVEMVIQQRIRAERAKTAASSPLAKQMRDWADIGNNMEKAMTGWMDSAADQMAELVTTGKADFASLFQSIAKDITKMGIKYLLSSAFGSMGGGGGLKSMLGGGAGKAAGGGGAAKTFGAMHTGGIVGAGFSMTRNVNPAIFGGAPRFHTGGVIGADEVPIIAQRGEGVFTKAQMAAMGGASGGNMVTIAPSIVVNASGGTPQQNADLAQQTAKAAEGMIRTIVDQRLMSQMRPGNMLNQ